MKHESLNFAIFKVIFIKFKKKNFYQMSNHKVYLNNLSTSNG